MILDVFKGLVEGLWRRWFGGGIVDYFESKGLTEDSTWYTKLLSSRGTQTVSNYIFLTLCFYISFNQDNTIFKYMSKIEGYWLWALMLVNAILFQSLFWSKGHGPIFDYGHGTPDEESIKRYNKFWWTRYLDKWWGTKPNKYGLMYDTIGMFIRYTYGALIVGCLQNFNLTILGILVAGSYSIMWAIWDSDNWIFSKVKPWFSGPTKIAECIAGFWVGFII